MLSTRTKRRSWLGALLLAGALALPLAAPVPAAADVRGTDVILGQTVEARGLPAVACPNITASYAVLTDENGAVLFARDADTQSHIASITKVMTAIVARDGQSANEAFVDAMNAKAAELGMEHSLFANPHGLDIDEFDNEMYSTAGDVALMCAYAMENETFRSIVAQQTAQITVAKPDGQAVTLDLVSSDLLLGVYEGACGIKTGYTEAAGNSFAGACNRGSGDLIAVVLGCPSETARFEDAKILFDWVYDNRVSYRLAHSERTVTMTADGRAEEVPLIAEVPFTAWTDKRVNATFADPKAAVEVFAPEGNVSQELVFDDLNGSVRAGDKVGTATFYQAGQPIATQDLVAAEDAAAPDFFQAIAIWWERLWAGFGGTELVAEPVVVNETPLIYDKAPTRSDQSVAAIASGEEDRTPADGDGATDDQQGAPASGASE